MSTKDSSDLQLNLKWMCGERKCSYDDRRGTLQPQTNFGHKHHAKLANQPTDKYTASRESLPYPHGWSTCQYELNHYETLYPPEQSSNPHFHQFLSSLLNIHKTPEIKDHTPHHKIYMHSPPEHNDAQHQHLANVNGVQTQRSPPYI